MRYAQVIGGATAECRTCDRIVVGLIPGWNSIKWLGLLKIGWATVCAEINHLGIITNTKVNSAFHPSGVAKSSTGLSGWG